MLVDVVKSSSRASPRAKARLGRTVETAENREEEQKE